MTETEKAQILTESEQNMQELANSFKCLILEPFRIAKGGGARVVQI